MDLFPPQEVPENTNICSDDCESLLKGMICIDPARRLTIKVRGPNCFHRFGFLDEVYFTVLCDTSSTAMGYFLVECTFTCHM